MNILEYIIGLPRVIKGKQIEKLNKNVDLMTLDEIAYELTAKLRAINKANEFDDRTDALITKMLEAGNDKTITDITIRCISLFKSDELKLYFIENYSNKLSDSVLDDLLKGYHRYFYAKRIDEDPKARREDFLNNIKMRVNGITSRFAKREVKKDNGFGGYFKRYENPLELELNYKEKIRLEKENSKLSKEVIVKLFNANRERINIYSFLNSVNDYSIIERIYDETPDENKEEFFLEYVRNLPNYLPYSSEDDERLENQIFERIPLETIKMEMLRSIANQDGFFRKFEDRVEILPEDVRNYCRATGSISLLIMYDYKDYVKVNTAEELMNELQYFKGDNRKVFFEHLIGNLEYEEKIKILDNYEIDDDIKNSVYKSLLWHNYNDNEKTIDLYHKLIETSKDEKSKNTYRIVIARREGDNDKVLELLKTGNYSVNLDVEKALEGLSKDTVKEIYDASEDEMLREHLLRLQEIDEEKDGVWNDDWGLFEPKYKLVNQENFVDFVKNAKYYMDIYILFSPSFRQFYDNLTLDQMMELYNEITNKNLIMTNSSEKPERYLRNFETTIADKINRENCFSLVNSNFPRSYLTDILDRKVRFDKAGIEDIKKYLSEVVNIDDIHLKDAFMDIIKHRYLSDSYREKDKKEQKKKYEELKVLYEEIIDSDETDIGNKYYFLSKYMGICYDQEINDNSNLERFIQIIEPKFRKINELAGKSEYTEMFDFTPQYKMSQIERKKYNVTNYSGMIDCVKYLGSDVVYDKLKKLYNGNHSIMQDLNASLLEPNVINLLDDDAIEFIGRYSVDASHFGEIFNNKEKTELYIRAYERLKTIKTYSEEDSLNLAKYVRGLNVENLTSDGDIDDKKLDTIIALAFSEQLRQIYTSAAIDREQNKLDAFTDAIKKRTRNEIHSKLLTRKQALDAIGTRFLGLSYEEMKSLSMKYAVDAELLISKYKDKKELTAEEQNELTTLRTVRNIKEILAIKDKKALVETFDELDTKEEFEEIDFSLANVLEENMKRAYAKDYKENVYTPKEEDKLEDVDGIKVYSPKEFNMLVHVVAAFGDFKLIDKEHPEKSARDFWRNVDSKKNHILCTSYIGNSNLCFKRKMESDKNSEVNVIFGFSNFSNNAVLMGAPYDIGSDTSSISSDRATFLSSFRTAKNMIKETRWLHNEVCVERRLENQKDTNIEPDYIVCVDEINEESKKVAKDFGIPIILLNTKEIAKLEKQKLDKLFEDYNKTNNPEDIEKILNLYHSNLNSYANYKSDLLNKYFNPEEMDKKIRKMMQDIEKQYELGDKENAARCSRVLYESIQRELDYYLKSRIEPEKEVKGKFKLRELKQLAKAMCEKVKPNTGNEKRKQEIENEQNKEGIALEVISKAKERKDKDDRE